MTGSTAEHLIWMLTGLRIFYWEPKILKGSWKSYFIMHLGMNFRLNRLYYPGGNVSTLLQTIDRLLDSLLLSLKAAINEFMNILYFSFSKLSSKFLSFTANISQKY